MHSPPNPAGRRNTAGGYRELLESSLAVIMASLGHVKCDGGQTGLGIAPVLANLKQQRLHHNQHDQCPKCAASVVRCGLLLECKEERTVFARVPVTVRVVSASLLTPTTGGQGGAARREERGEGGGRATDV